MERICFYDEASCFFRNLFEIIHQCKSYDYRHNHNKDRFICLAQYFSVNYFPDCIENDDSSWNKNYHSFEKGSESFYFSVSIFMIFICRFFRFPDREKIHKRYEKVERGVYSWSQNSHASGQYSCDGLYEYQEYRSKTCYYNCLFFRRHYYCFILLRWFTIQGLSMPKISCLDNIKEFFHISNLKETFISTLLNSDEKSIFSIQSKTSPIIAFLSSVAFVQSSEIVMVFVFSLE